MSVQSFIGGIGGPELVIVPFLVVLLFGANKLPELARASGEAVAEFQKGRERIEREIRDATRTTTAADADAVGDVDAAADVDADAAPGSEPKTEPDAGVDADDDVERDRAPAARPAHPRRGPPQPPPDRRRRPRRVQSRPQQRRLPPPPSCSPFCVARPVGRPRSDDAVRPAVRRLLSHSTVYRRVERLYRRVERQSAMGGSHGGRNRRPDR